MIPTKGKILLKVVEEKKGKIVLLNEDKKDKSNITGDFFIEKLGKECDEDLKAGQKVHLRQHFGSINVTKKEDKPEDTGIWLLVIDQSEIWAVENV